MYALENTDDVSVLECLKRGQKKWCWEEKINMSFGEGINSSHLHQFLAGRRPSRVKTKVKVVLTNQINVRCVDCKECTFDVFEQKEG